MEERKCIHDWENSNTVTCPDLTSCSNGDSSMVNGYIVACNLSICNDNDNNHIYTIRTTTTPQPFYSPFPRQPAWVCARRKLFLDFMVLERITRGRHTDNPGGRHSYQTNQQSTSINPLYLYSGWPSCHYPPNLSYLGTDTGICWIAYPHGLVI